MAIYIKKVWGLREPIDALQFNRPGNRANALKALKPGDRVVVCSTKGKEVEPPEQRGKVFALLELTQETRDNLNPEGLTDIPRNARGDYRWPYDILVRRAWSLVTPVPLEKITSRNRKLGTPAANSIVPLEMEEEQRVLALRWRRAGGGEAWAGGDGARGGETRGSRKASPPPGDALMRLVMLRHDPADTYCMELVGKGAFKIGWAFDAENRQREFNHASMPSLGGIYYELIRRVRWPSARDAWRMEQSILRALDAARSPHNHEVLLKVRRKELEKAWRTAIVKVNEVNELRKRRLAT